MDRGSAHIELAYDSERADLRVADHGPGIPQEAMTDALQPFMRLERSRNRETGGTGLGLPIAASIAAAHGSQLVLRKNSPDGLIAVLVLPQTTEQ